MKWNPKFFVRFGKVTDYLLKIYIEFGKDCPKMKKIFVAVVFVGFLQNGFYTIFSYQFSENFRKVHSGKKGPIDQFGAVYAYGQFSNLTFPYGPHKTAIRILYHMGLKIVH